MKRHAFLLFGLLIGCGGEPARRAVANPPTKPAVARVPVPASEPMLAIDHPCAKGDILACARLGLSLDLTVSESTIGDVARNHAALGDEQNAEALISGSDKRNPHGLMLMVGVGFLEGGDRERAHAWFEKARLGPPYFTNVMIESYVQHGFDAEAERLAAQTGAESKVAQAMFEHGRSPADVMEYLKRCGHDLQTPRGGEVWAEIYGRIGMRDPGVAFLDGVKEPAHHLDVMVAVAEGDRAAGRTSGVEKMLRLGKKHLRRGQEGVDEGGHKLHIGSKTSTLRALVLLSWRVHGLDEARTVAALDDSHRSEALAYVACHMHKEGKTLAAAQLLDELVPKKNTWWGPQNAHRAIARSAAAGGCADLAKRHIKAAVDHIRTYPDEDIIGNHNRLPGELAAAGLWKDAAYICQRRDDFVGACLVDDVLRPAAQARQSDFIVEQLHAIDDPAMLGAALSLLAVSLKGAALADTQRATFEKETREMLLVWLVRERVQELYPGKYLTTFRDDGHVLLEDEVAFFIGTGPDDEKRQTLKERGVAIVSVPDDWDGTTASLNQLIDGASRANGPRGDSASP